MFFVLNFILPFDVLVLAFSKTKVSGKIGRYSMIAEGK
jgi:hypothetical protein